jgi:hypothetical protein
MAAGHRGQARIGQRLDIPSSKPLVEALHDISVFADLTEERLQWFAAHAEDLHFESESGDVLFDEGDTA